MEIIDRTFAKDEPLWRWRPLIAVWTVPILLAGITQRLTPESGMAGIPPLLGAALFWYAWALVTPPIFALTARWPPTPPLRARSLASHAALAGAVVAAFALLLTVTSSWTGEPPLDEPFADRFLAVLSSPAVPALITIHSLVVIAALGLGIRQRARLERARTVALIAERDRLARGLAESRLEALQHQLRPHFLFNTLHAISALMDSRKDAARRMTARLATLLRASFEAPLEITLDEEIELLESYLDIERLRFGDRLVVEYNIDPSARRAKVPSFLLQPLVENAIQHGFHQAGGGRIIIHATCDAARLALDITDDGIGLAIDTREPAVSRDGIGLSNVRARLAERYPDMASLRVEDRPGGGVCAHVEIHEPSFEEGTSLDEAEVDRPHETMNAKVIAG